jgi:hypothetical protein
MEAEGGGVWSQNKEGEKGWTGAMIAVAIG